MSPNRGASLALVTPAHSTPDFERVARIDRSSGRERREHTRLTPAGLRARLKYGDTVTLLDVSAGGALVETARVLRPDTDLVLEIFDSRTKNVTQMISRVLRSQVAALDGGIRYRGACRFRQLLAHPSLLSSAPAPLLHTDANDFLKLEFALKTIVEGYFRSSGSGSAGRWRDASALLDALSRLRAAAERRDDHSNRQLAQLLGAALPGLERGERPQAIIRQLQDHLGRQLPLLAIRASGRAHLAAADREVVTLTMAADPDQPRIAVTAEFPSGFALNEAQFRLLKAGAYLVGLLGRWPRSSDESELSPTDTPDGHDDARASAPPPVPVFTAVDEEDLPVGWQRIVIRYADGQLLRGYSNDFYPDRAHLHLSPRVKCGSDERLLVPIPRLKAVFFVKSLYGDPQRVDDSQWDHSPGARKVEVLFRDGELLRGWTLNYKPNGQGFFLHPANARSNNLRIFVVATAIRHMRFV